MPDSAPRRLAAIDLGSNSFHMVVARLVNGEPSVIDRIREQVQLAAGLDEGGELSAEAQERALACLARFGQRLRDVPGLAARAVGTNTLRSAANAGTFLASGEEALGLPIEVISGQEEARLIYLGVAHTIRHEQGNRLVVDIGGGSTECILGRAFNPLEKHSLYMGCVSWSRRFMPKGKLTRKALNRAVMAARLELQPLERAFRETGWSRVIGASGTIRAAETTLRALGHDGITREGLERLTEEVLAAGHFKQLALSGLKAERAPVFAGGLAILIALFDSLQIDRMEVSAGALRDGVIYDLLGRIRQEDVRERTILQFQNRFHVDQVQAARVERTALHCLAQVATQWDLESNEARTFLAWAARLHEIGLAVSYGHQHRHAAYLAAHSDLPGFSRDDQQILAALLANQRRKIAAPVFGALPSRWRDPALKLTLLLRLAILLNRGRSNDPPRPQISGDARQLRLTLPDGYLEDCPLTRMDLEAESRTLEPTGYEIVIESGPSV